MVFFFGGGECSHWMENISQIVKFYTIMKVRAKNDPNILKEEYYSVPTRSELFLPELSRESATVDKKQSVRDQ